MICSAAVGAAAPMELAGGLVELLPEHELLPAAAGYCLFGVVSHQLPGSGPVTVDIVAPLDGRRYSIRRSLDVAEHWQVLDAETGWLAANGSVDTTRWLHDTLGIAEDVPLPLLFQEIVQFSIPVVVAMLADGSGLRERKLARLLRTERYPAGSRWLETVYERLRADTQAVELGLRELDGQDRAFDRLQRRLDTARAECEAAAADVTAIRRRLEQAEARRERLGAVRADLEAVRQEMSDRAALLASLDAQVSGLQRWQEVREQALQAAEALQPDWRAYQEAVAAIQPLRARLSILDALRGRLQSATAEVAALNRQQGLLQAQLRDIQSAETAAAGLAAPVQQQQHLEQQLSAAQDRALRLDVVSKALQHTLNESRRVEVLLAEAERQVADLEQLRAQTGNLRRLRAELEAKRAQAREAERRVDQLHFLETAVKSIGGHLDDLRKSGAGVDQLEAAVSGGNGARADEGQRGTVRLRDALERQRDGLERRLREWQAQCRELAGEPMRLNQLRAAIHQLEQEIDAARQVEIKVAARSAFKQHCKYLREQLEQLKKLSDAQLKEQQQCSDAPARASQLRHDLAALQDPRSEQQALLRLAARKQALETEIRQLAKKIAEAHQRRQELEDQLATEDVREALAEEQRRRDEAHPGYCNYLAQQAVIELTAAAASELPAVVERRAAVRAAQDEAEARETGLRALVVELEGAPAEVLTLQAQLEAAEDRLSLWNSALQSAADDFAAAQENRRERERVRARRAIYVTAQRLLDGGMTMVRKAETALCSHLCQDVAEDATKYLRLLLDNPAIGLSWQWGNAPVVTREGGTRPFSECSSVVQACCALSVQLALLASSQRFSVAMVNNLGAIATSGELMRRLKRLPLAHQLLLLPC